MITYLQGDATDPQTPGNRIIAHVCNDIGAWGRGFVLSLSQRWPLAEEMYRRWHRDQEECLINPTVSAIAVIGRPMKLGNVQYVTVDTRADGGQLVHTYVANMVAQAGIRTKGGIAPIRYHALQQCLEDVASFVQCIGGGTVHMPRIGCGLAGGHWTRVVPIVGAALARVPTFVYDLSSSSAAPGRETSDGVQDRDRSL